MKFWAWVTIATWPILLGLVGLCMIYNSVWSVLLNLFWLTLHSVYTVRISTRLSFRASQRELLGLS